MRDETPGLVVGKREPAMGIRGIPECEMHFEDMEIAEDMVVCRRKASKRGFAGLMDAYNAQRVGAGTVALGIAQGAYEEALAYTREREQFGRPIAEFQGCNGCWPICRSGWRRHARCFIRRRAVRATGFRICV